MTSGNGHGAADAATWAVQTAPSPEPDAYLLERGFSPEIIAHAGWRVERLGDRARRYGFRQVEAADVRAWFIPYRHPNGHVAFERIRLIDQQDLDRFGGGKYRQPANRSLALYDPFGALAVGGPVDALLLVEGEANAVSLHMLELGLPVVGLPGQTALTVELAEQLGHLPLVIVWLDQHDPGAEQNGRRIADRLLAAGVEDVRFIADTAGLDANEALQLSGIEETRILVGGLLDRAIPLALDETAPASREYSWPAPLDECALHGIAGDVVRAIEPHSESDPAALLLQFLVAFGNAVGPGPGLRAEADHHGVNLYVVLVGETAKGRKGSSWSHILSLMRQADQQWVEERVQSGVTSGEGLLWEVRDPVVKQVAQKDGKKTVGWDEEEVDPGVSDKRLLAMESEFASVLRVAKRDNSTVSTMIRLAWDGRPLQTMTKNSPARATGTHISIIGHITRDELRRELDGTDHVNGFANRFLFAGVRRSKALPFGGSLTSDDLAPLAESIRLALRHASVAERMRENLGQRQLLDRDARDLWEHVYVELSEGQRGLLGAVTSRAEALVMRIACIYALLDLSDGVNRVHLEAALAVWKYCEESARHIFGDALGDPLADEILRALREAGALGLSRTELRNHFGRNRSGEQIERSLQLLEAMGYARIEKQASGAVGGRRREQWFAE